MKQATARFKLQNLYLKGYTSIDGIEGIHLPLGDVTVLLGANGSGKSNILSFFVLLRMLGEQNLYHFVSKNDFDRLLYYGPDTTNSVDCCLRFDDGADTLYSFSLQSRKGGWYYWGPQQILFRPKDCSNPAKRLPVFHGVTEDGTPISAADYTIKSGEWESDLKKDTRDTSKLVCDFLSRIRRYQFHNTSEYAKIREKSYVDDSLYLCEDASNLAAFLYRLKTTPEFTSHYERIVWFIRIIMPQLKDFILEPDQRREVRLNWVDKTGKIFDSNQLSDGILRFAALTTVLLQPKKLCPSMILLDEPELGLHPAAIAYFAAMLPVASQYSQIILATQSPWLVNELEAQDIRIVEWDEHTHRTTVHALDMKALQSWLEKYTLSELWEMDLLGGRP